MANPAVTYSFSNSSVADANQVNQNFTDIINSLTDASKSLSIDALTVAGNFSATGTTNTIGNAAGDDFVLTASLASTIAIKTTATYGIGDATHGLTGIYFGANSQTVRIAPSGSMSATWTLTMPTTAGTNLQYLMTNGSGVTSWDKTAATSTVSGFVTSYEPTIVSAIVTTATTPYTVGAGETMVLASHTSDQTITLPTASSNAGRRIYIKKTGATGKTILSSAGSDTLDGYTLSGGGYYLTAQYAWVEVASNGTNWFVIGTGGDFIAGTNNSWTTAQLNTVNNAITLTIPVGLWELYGEVYWSNNALVAGAIAGFTLTSNTSSSYLGIGNGDSAQRANPSATTEDSSTIVYIHAQASAVSIYLNGGTNGATSTSNQASFRALRLR